MAREKWVEKYNFKNPIYYEVATDRQKEVLDAVNKHKTLKDAGDVLGISAVAVKKNLGFVVSKANKAGKSFNASGDVTITASEGYQVGKVTIQRKPEYTCPECGHVDPERIVNVWDRQFLEPAAVIANALETFELKPLPKITPI